MFHKTTLIGLVILFSTPSFAKTSQYDCESVKYGTLVKVTIDDKGSRGTINYGWPHTKVYIEDIGFVISRSGDMGYITKSGEAKFDFQVLECKVTHK